MSTVLSSVTRRAAKSHRCWYCGQRIEVKELHGYRTGTNCGDFWEMRFHPECDDWASKHWSNEDWEFGEPSDFKRPMTAFDPSI